MDSREIFVDGEKVEDILNHPSLKRYVNYAAGDFDLALNPKYHDLVTEELPSGERVHFTFVSPRSNVAKYFFDSQYAQAEQYLQDFAGGLVGTLPSLKELENPEAAEYVKKYLGTGNICSAEDRMKLFKYTKDLCDHVEGNVTIHAEGSLAAQRLMM